MRKQYYINSYKFKNLKEEKDKLIFEESTKVSYPISESLLFKKLYEITNKEYIEKIKDEKAKPIDNPLEDLFILKASNSVTTEEDEKKYDKLVEDGCYIGDVHYLYAEKSSSMIRTQKTVFIKESIVKTLQEHLTLGKEPSQCVTSKFLTTKGYLLSSVDVCDMLPRICVIEDFETIINSDVYIMENYKPTDADKEVYENMKKERQEQLEEQEEYKAKLDEAHNVLNVEYFHNKLSCSYVDYNKDKNIKSMRGWKKEGRRVMVEELLNPCNYSDYKGDYYPMYGKNQTEEIKIIPATPMTCETEKVFHKDYPVSINAFDGEGIGSQDFFHKVQEKLGIKHEINSLQMRLPYVKSNVVRVDWKNWMLSHGIRYIQPMSLNGEPVEPVSIFDIDVLICESSFKCRLEKAEKKNPWLFSSMEEYYTLLKKYGWNYFGICNYSHSHRKVEYNTTTYQFINSTELNTKDLFKMYKEEEELLNKVEKGDVDAIKFFLDLVINKNDINEEDDDKEPNIDEDDIKDKAKVIMAAIETNAQAIYDPEVQKFIGLKIKNYRDDLKIGRILIPSSFNVSTCDVIAFMEWASLKNRKNEEEKLKVKGFLKADEFYCNGKNGEYILARYPLCHHSEFKIGNFIKTDNKWVKHLNNITQFNIYDLSIVHCNQDHDGDKNLIVKADMPISDNRTLKDAIILDYPIFNPGDKTTANASKFDTESILKFEKLNLDNKTGKITNLNSHYQAFAHAQGGIWKRDYESSVLKALQGLQIDSAKSGKEVIIPEPLKQNGWQKPYFLKFKYEATKDDAINYMNPCCPLDYFAEAMESKTKERYANEEKEIKLTLQDKIEVNVYKKDENGIVVEDKNGNKTIESSYFVEYMKGGSTARLWQRPVVDSKRELELYGKLIPIFNDYSHKRGLIVKDGKNQFKMAIMKENEEIRNTFNNKLKDSECELLLDGEFVVFNRNKKEVLRVERSLLETPENHTVDEFIGEKIKIGQYLKILATHYIVFSFNIVFSSLEDKKDYQKLVKVKYKDLYEDTRQKAVQACVESLGELDEGILASWAVKIDYINAKDKDNNEVHANKTFNFPWVVSLQGMIENIKLHQEEVSRKLYNISNKEMKNLENGITMINYFGKIVKVETVVNNLKPKEIEKALNINIVPIKNYKCNLMFCNGKEAYKKLKDNENKATLKLKDGLYYTFYIGDEFVASVVSGYIDFAPNEEQKEQGIKGFTLRDYVGKEFSIEVTKVNTSSLITNISYIPEMEQGIA